jgi:crotonobetainyl-CoA:carnitine CoA-transferase CaiB-like acyl-CoA transferase
VAAHRQPLKNRSMTNNRFKKGPLEGVRIVDLTTVVLGPYATRILADLGADVIKVETLAGDQTRHYKPLKHEGMAGYFLNLNRNKRSISIDLKTPDGMAILKRLVSGADAFVHNMRQQAADRLGLGYEGVRALNPDIVYCAAVGFGSAGPYSGRAAYDDVIQAGSGLAGLHAMVHGEPAFAPTVLCDKITGQTVAYAVMGALLQQAKGGGGQAVEVPMLETAAEFALVEHMHGATFEPPLGEIGFKRVLSRYRKPFRTADGYMCILPYSDSNWADFFRFTERTEFLGDPRFRVLADRVQHIDLLYALVEEEAPRFTNAEWQAFCDRVSIPCMPVKSLDEVLHDEHLAAVQMFSMEQHPTEGAYRVVRSPVQFAAPFQLRHHAPRLGEDSVAVLEEAGFSGAEIEGFLRDGVVHAPVEMLAG